MPNMISCPFCDTVCEPWQVYCHDCGQSVSSFEVPIIASDIAPGTDLIKAFRQWMKRGKQAIRNGFYDEAHASFAEALKRVHGLERYRNEEIHAREKLSDALQRLGKLDSAIEQLVKAGAICEHKKHKEYLQDKVAELSKQLGGGTQDRKTDGNLRIPKLVEYMTAPLHCAACMRLLPESEVYRFRSGQAEHVVCACSYRGTPLTLGDNEETPKDLFGAEPPQSIPKAKLIEAAQMPVEKGRNRTTAFWLAITLGAFGAHKFYLGNKMAGYCYAVMFWTLIPWLVSLYEAIHIFQMSRVAFNLAYNIEEVIKRLPKDDLSESELSGVFSMVVVEQTDNLRDEWSSEDEI